jgi:hypothetical protein
MHLRGSHYLACGVCVVLVALTVASVRAEPHGHNQDSTAPDPHGRETHGHDFHGQDFHHFGAADRAHWQGGHWVHGWHDGRFAWWWMADGVWYFYPAPIYPYPTYIPPAIVVQQAPPVPTGLPPAQFWYYCDNPTGYFPYVAACDGPLRPVTAVPPAAPPR